MRRTKKHYLEEQNGKRVELRLWRKWRRERIEVLLASPMYGDATSALLAFMKTATSSRAVLDYIDAGPWRDADEDIRMEILSLVDQILIKRRAQQGQPPFDDPLPSQADSLFLILRARLSS